MASDASKRGSKSGPLPGKLRTFVQDMKRFRIHRRERKTEQPMPKPTSIPEAPQTHDTPETKPVSSPRSSLPVAANLAIQVTITFDEPLNYSYTRNYEASPALQATEALCQGLLRRVDHCCHELITRKDSTAMEYAAASGSDKPLRYEIQIDIIRGWSEIWASRTFKSYQKQLLSAEAAKEIIISTHHIVGLFLRHHDEGFAWKDGPVRDDPLEEQGKFPHRAGRVQPLSCVPRSYFLEKSQAFESIPGYTISFSFTSRCQRRKQPEWHTTVEVNSSQTAPLNSVGAENLFFEASYALEGVLRLERQAFEKVHGLCISLDGCKDCRHHDNDGLDLHFSIMNNLGPQFPELERTIHCNSNLSFHSDAQKCLTFVNKVETALGQVRDATDDTISRMNDLEFRITELRGRGWSLDEPLAFLLDSSHAYSRRSVEAVLDRIQAGVADTLRGNAISVRMTAHKRGHFILDKTFVAREPFETTEKKKAKSSGKSKAYVLDRLRQRIERDIAMICKDTLTLDDEEENGKTDKGICVLEQTFTHDADVSTSTSGVETIESLSKDTTEQREESARPCTSPATSVSKSVIYDYDLACAAANRGDTEHELSPPPSPSKCRPPIPVRRSSMTAVICPTSGARSLLSALQLDGYVELESPRPHVDSDENNSHQAVSDEPIGVDPRRVSSAPATPRKTVNETKGSEEKRPVTPSNGEEPGSAAAYENSIASSTPSLDFGGCSSPDSSLLVTPKTHRLSREVDYPKNAIIDSDDEEGSDSVSIGVEAHPCPAKSVPFPSPTLRHAGKPITSSPLRVSQTVHEQSDVSSSEISESPPEDGNEDASRNSDKKESPNDTEAIQIHHTSATEIEHPEVFTSAESTDKQDLDTTKTETKIENQNSSSETTKPSPSIEIESPNHTKQPATSEDENQNESENEEDCHEAAANDFAQSKPDFTFSSPPAATPEVFSEDEDENHNQNQNTPNSSPSPVPRALSISPDPSEDLELDTDMDKDMPPPRPFHTQRSSFGSAGMLGFHEQMFGSLSLRTALMRSRPTSSYGVGDAGHGVKRPGSATS
ncbi:hypothetical protein F5Y06DRAFT_166184 [Hypoxylon sp. FL0890]|nr:hypothetical protein F5Y06DRAFT_166184 [Hypoxylon sp. FL0890]